MAEKTAQEYVDAIPEDMRRHVWHKLGAVLRDANGGAQTQDDSGNTPPPPPPPPRQPPVKGG